MPVLNTVKLLHRCRSSVPMHMTLFSHIMVHSHCSSTVRLNGIQHTLCFIIHICSEVQFNTLSSQQMMMFQSYNWQSMSGIIWDTCSRFSTLFMYGPQPCRNTTVPPYTRYVIFALTMVTCLEISNSHRPTVHMKDSLITLKKQCLHLKERNSLGNNIFAWVLRLHMKNCHLIMDKHISHMELSMQLPQSLIYTRSSPPSVQHHGQMILNCGKSIIWKSWRRFSITTTIIFLLFKRKVIPQWNYLAWTRLGTSPSTINYHQLLQTPNSQNFSDTLMRLVSIISDMFLVFDPTNHG